MNNGITNDVNEMVNEVNKRLRERYGKDITLKIYAYIKDDDSVWFEYRGTTTDGEAFYNLDICYQEACKYMDRGRWD